jgi:Fic family protein
MDNLPAGTYARKIFNHLLINLSYNSARLEGNTYSLVDTEKLLLEGKTAENKLDMETVMLLNHKEAIRYLVDGINRMEINIDNIRHWKENNYLQHSLILSSLKLDKYKILMNKVFFAGAYFLYPSLY